MSASSTDDPERDYAARVLAGTLATVPAAPEIKLVRLGVFSAGDRHRVIYDIRVDGEFIGTAVEWIGQSFAFCWGLTIPGVVVNFGFPSRETLEIAVQRFVAVGNVEG